MKLIKKLMGLILWGFVLVSVFRAGSVKSLWEANADKPWNLSVTGSTVKCESCGTSKLTAWGILSSIGPVDGCHAPEAEEHCSFSNSQSDILLNVTGSGSQAGTNVNIFRQDGTAGQGFTLTANGSMTYGNETYTKYVITPDCAGECALNVRGKWAKEGANVNIWPKSGNATQDWIFQAVDGGWVIRSADDPAYVLTAMGSDNKSNVKLATYDLGNACQIWNMT